MSIRCSIATIGPIHIWEDVRTDTIYLEDAKGGCEIEIKELIQAANDIIDYLGKRTIK